MSGYRDKALSFHWEADPAALPFLGRAAFDETVRSIVTEAWLVCRDDPEQGISYSRRWAFYKRTRYRRTIYGYTSVLGAIDFLDSEGWIVHHRQEPGSQNRRQSSFRASPKLMAIDRAIAPSFSTVETIVLRDRADKKRVEYSDTGETRRMRRHLEELNESISSVEIAHPDLGSIRIGSPTKIGGANPGPARQSLSRVFNGGFDRGGRFYGGFWMGMKSAERKRLTIDGQNVTELDYKGIHPRLLYAEAGATLDGDPYDIPGYPRKLVKLAFNIMVNARDRSGALKATLRKARELTKDDAIPEGYCTSLTISALLGAIEERHQSIAHAFCSDSGVRLQRIDSGIAERVMLDLVRKGIVSLPIHDSFITRAEFASQLEEAMDKAMRNTLKSLIEKHI